MSEDNIELIEIPVNVHRVQDPTGRLTTTKSLTDVNEMFEQVNQIWNPAGIRFRPNNINPLTIQIEELIPRFYPPNPIQSRNPIDVYYVNNFIEWMSVTFNEINRTHAESFIN